MTASRLRQSANFRVLWASTSISHLGSMFGALSLTALLYLDASAAQMGLLVAATTLPALVVGLMAGVIVDRWPRRTLMAGADLGRFGLLISVPAAAAAGRLGMEQLYGVAFGAGCLEVLFELAYRAFLPSVVPASSLVDANARLRMSESVAESAGPSIGGGIVQAAGAPVAVLVDALTFLASGLLLGRLRTDDSPAMRTGAALWTPTGALEGARTALRDPCLRAILGLSGTYGFFASFLITLFALRALRELGISPLALGLLAGAGGLGAFAGAIIVAPVTRRLGAGPVIVSAYVLATLFDLTTPLAAGPAWLAFIVLCAGYFGSDLFYALHNVAALSLRQAITPLDQLGRVNATFLMVNRSLRPAGAVAAGLTAEAIGVREALFVGSAGIIGAAAWLFWSPLPRLKAIPAVASATGWLDSGARARE